MIHILEQNTLLLIFIVIAIGYLIGTIKIGKFTAGVAAVLFTGLAFGGISPDFHVPEIVIFLGLSIFVYTIGLSSGPGFFRALNKGSKNNLSFLAVFIIVSILITVAVYYGFNLDEVTAASMYAGGHTNTPALASLLDVIANQTKGDAGKILQEKAVVGYSLTYPMGVIGSMIALMICIKLFKIDFSKEEQDLRKVFPVRQNIKNRLIEITNLNYVGKEIRQIKLEMPYRIVFGRLIRNDEMILTNYDTKLELGDHVLLAADEEALDEITSALGQISTQTASDFNEYSERRIFVSNPDIAGRTLSSLDISRRFSAIVSRVTRGDDDILASGNTVLELGDRVRVVGRRSEISNIKELFGDSYDALSHINLLSFGLGLALGLLLGMFTIQLPGGIPFSLGYAGGPLIIALILGTLRRTGPIVWSLPYSANLTLQQIGLTIMLAGIGVNSGHAFFDTILTPEGLKIFGVGTLMVVASAVITAIISYKLIKIPMSLLLGMMSNQPAILDFARSQTNNSLPNIGYTALLPLLIIVKLIVVQVLYVIL